MKPRVVMVDDEEDLVWSTARRLRRDRPDLDAVGFADPQAALAEVRRQPPDLLITDVRMPGMTGLELMMAARASVPELPVVVITAYGGPEVLAEVRRRGAVDYLEKPFAFAALTACIDRLLARRRGFSGAISLPLLPDLIQIYTLSLATGALHIRRGGESGAIWFERGAIVHATCGAERGAAAVYQLLHWQGGQFELASGALAPERTITVSWQEVLMEGCRRLDEHQRASARGAAEGEEAARRACAIVGWTRELLATCGTEALVIGIDRHAGVTGAVQGTPGEIRDWLAPVTGLTDAAIRLAGHGAGEGAVELLGETVGVAIAWGLDGSTVTMLADLVDGRAAAARFRSSTARLLAAARGHATPEIHLLQGD